MGIKGTSPPGTSARAPRSTLFSMNTTGLSSRTAETIRPLASYALDGINTFSPGVWASQASSDCECCAPALTLAVGDRDDHRDLDLAAVHELHLGGLVHHLVEGDGGFVVFEAAWTARALDLAERLLPDVVIAGEPELCRRLRAGEPGRSSNRNVPVIVLTEPGAEPIVRVRALESGADDAVPRDIYLELLARVRALLRRSTIGQADLVEAGPIVVDHRARQVRVGNVAVRLSGREYELAAKLASDPQRVFTKTELLRVRLGHPRQRDPHPHRRLARITPAAESPGGRRRRRRRESLGVR